MNDEYINIPKNREDLTKRVSKLIADMCLRWREHFPTAPPVEFIQSTAIIIVGEVTCYQLAKNLNEAEKDKSLSVKESMKFLKEDDNDTDN